MNRSLLERFNHAVSGIIIAFSTERNFKIHYGIAIFVILLSLFFDFSRTEFLLLLFSVSLVIVSEMINTAIERTIDLITKDYHPLARLVKDVSAGAVLISAINSIVVGYLLFFDRLSSFSELLLFKIKRSSIHLTFVALFIVIVLTIALKSKFYKGKGTHFQGGVVSGHCAIAFCVATVISFLAENILIGTFAIGLALLVAESRIEAMIHSLSEVVLGSLLGVIIGILVFQGLG